MLKKEYGKKEGIDEGDTIIAQIEKKEISLIIGTRKRKSRKTKNWERSSKNNDWELSSIKPTTVRCIYSKNIYSNRVHTHKRAHAPSHKTAQIIIAFNPLRYIPQRRV